MPSREPTRARRLYALPEPEELDTEALDEQAARATSCRIWRALCAGTTYEKLTAALAAEYRGEVERAAADVDAFLAALHGEQRRAS